MSRSQLGIREHRALHGALDRLYQPVLPSEFPDHLLGVLSELLPGTSHRFDSLELATGRVQSHAPPVADSIAPVTPLEAAMRASAGQNPVVSFILNHPAPVARLGDPTARREFQKTDFYRHRHAPPDTRHPLAAGVGRSGHAVAFVINRGGSRSFNAREIELVRRLRPHVERALAQTLLVAGLRRQLAQTVPDGPRGSSAGAGTSKLTPREAEVLSWMALGKRDGEIAVIFGVAPRTVHKHVEHILDKLGAETRTAAAALVRGARVH